MSDKRPCPFCGRDEPTLITENYMAGHGEARLIYYVKCERCACRGPQTHKSSDNAVKLWNERIIKPDQVRKTKN